MIDGAVAAPDPGAHRVFTGGSGGQGEIPVQKKPVVPALGEAYIQSPDKIFHIPG